MGEFNDGGCDTFVGAVIIQTLNLLLSFTVNLKEVSPEKHRFYAAYPTQAGGSAHLPRPPIVDQTFLLCYSFHHCVPLDFFLACPSRCGESVHAKTLVGYQY